MDMFWHKKMYHHPQKISFQQKIYPNALCFFFVGALLRTLQRMVTHTMALHFSGGSGAAADVHTLRMVLNVWRLVSPHGWTSDQSFTSSDKVAHLVGPWWPNFSSTLSIFRDEAKDSWTENPVLTQRGYIMEWNSSLIFMAEIWWIAPLWTSQPLLNPG